MHVSFNGHLPFSLSILYANQISEPVSLTPRLRGLPKHVENVKIFAQIQPALTVSRYCLINNTMVIKPRETPNITK